MPHTHKQSCHSFVPDARDGDRDRTVGQKFSATGKNELQACPLVEEDWARVVSQLPSDLEDSARAAKAIVRRREIRSASDALRLALAYALCDWPLRLVGAWATVKGLGNLSDVAVLNRLRAAKTWMGMLLATVLITQRTDLGSRDVRIRLVDATVVNHPGSKSTDWRIHLSFTLNKMCIDGVEVTDVHGGETLVRHEVQEKDILIVDGGYAHRKGIGEVLAKGGQLVVRINWQNLPMRDEDGKALEIMEFLRQVPLDGPSEKTVEVDTPQGSFQMRLIAQRLSEKAANAARRRAREAARKKGRTPDKRTLEAAGFIFVISSLPIMEWSAKQVLELYRIRWQVELVFKRLKGVLNLDHLRAKDSDLAQVYLLGKLLGALIIEGWAKRLTAGCDEWVNSVGRPLSQWRWLTLWAQQLISIVRGRIALEELRVALPKLQRYLCDTPRKRVQQCANARHLFRLTGEQGLQNA